MSTFERYAARKVLEQAARAGLEIPRGLANTIMCGGGTHGAVLWVRAHPDDKVGGAGCCDGDALNGPESCTCWVPEFELEQAEPRPPASPDDIGAQPRMCHDCAFRPGSPERAEEWTEQALFDLAATEQPFWCHQGMRRPVRWLHPDGRVVDGSTDDWRPPMQGGVPYLADGAPALLCAGWVRHAARFDREARDAVAAERGVAINVDDTGEQPSLVAGLARYDAAEGQKAIGPAQGPGRSIAQEGQEVGTEPASLAGN